MIVGPVGIQREDFSGDRSEGDTPVPIPNTAVKPLSPDGTALATAWESRTLPGIKKQKAPGANPGAFCVGWRFMAASTYGISHDRQEETWEAKARWFQSLSLEERMEYLCWITDLILENNPRAGELRDVEPVAGRVRVVGSPGV